MRIIPFLYHIAASLFKAAFIIVIALVTYCLFIPIAFLLFGKGKGYFQELGLIDKRLLYEMLDFCIHWDEGMMDDMEISLQRDFHPGRPFIQYYYRHPLNTLRNKKTIIVDENLKS